jgi:hypothetical protein
MHRGCDAEPFVVGIERPASGTGGQVGSEDHVTYTVRIAEALEDAIAMFDRWRHAGWDIETFGHLYGCDPATSAHIFRALEQLDFIRRRADGLYVHTGLTRARLPPDGEARST